MRDKEKDSVERERDTETEGRRRRKKRERKRRGGREKGLEYPNSDIDQETGKIGKWLRVLSVPLCNLCLVSDLHVRQITTIYNSLHLEGTQNALLSYSGAHVEHTHVNKRKDKS